MAHISVVIPLLNEEGIVKELINRVDTNLKKITEDYLIILIDDGSTDKTWEAIENEFLNNKKLSAIKFSRNFGHHYAITAGIDHSKSDWVIVMDGDLQDRPEVIPELYEKAKQGFDVVFVNRVERKESLSYLLTQKLFYRFLNILSGIKFNSKQANFSIISFKVAEAHKQFREQSRFYGSTIKWLGFSEASIEAPHGKRLSGKPSYTLKKRFQLAFDIILSFSERPLKFVTSLGLTISVASLIFAFFIAFKAQNSEFSVMGWPSIIFSIFFTTGINLTILGILGIYIGRVFNQVKQRPLYLVEKLLN